MDNSLLQLQCMVQKIKNIHRRLMASTLVIGVRVQICQAFGLPEGRRASHAAKLASDPNNQLPPEGANFPWGGPAKNCMAPKLLVSINHHD